MATLENDPNALAFFLARPFLLEAWLQAGSFERLGIGELTELSNGLELLTRIGVEEMTTL